MEGCEDMVNAFGDLLNEIMEEIKSEHEDQS